LLVAAKTINVKLNMNRQTSKQNMHKCYADFAFFMQIMHKISLLGDFPPNFSLIEEKLEEK